MASRRSPFLPVDTFFTLDPERSVVHATLGLTAYLDEPRRWAFEWIAEVFASFAARVHPQALRWVTTSQEARWRPLDSLTDVRDALVAGPLTGRLRHLLTVRVADRPHAPRVGFVYREVDPARTTASAYLQVHFPIDAAPDELLAFAIELGQRYALHSAVGGYGFAWNPAHPYSAFRAIRDYLRRFLAVDVQDPEAAAWQAAQALPGIHWLTLIGNTAPGLDRAFLPSLARTEEVAVLPLARATLVRAGQRPRTGDVNQMEHPRALASVARQLDPFVIADPPRFPGPFSDPGFEKETADWRHRFAAPERWP